MPDPTFLQSLLAGATAGTAVDLLFFPIDTLKTRLQSAQGFVRAGGFGGIYKGVGSVIIGSAPGAAAFFSTYDTLKKHSPLPPEYAPITHMASASVGEVAACLIRVPTDIVKTRMQTSTYGDAAPSSLSVLRLVLQTQGIRGLYQGFGITIMREIPFTSLQFPLYELLKHRLSTRVHRKPLYAHEAAACGSVAGGVAAALTTPLDVLKTRVMLDLRVCSFRFPDRPEIEPDFAQSTSKDAMPSLFKRARTIYTQEGFKALFAGVVPRTMWISAGG
ncbi:hypothetical protein APHAL10511_006905 [Amanita phalloides]|nr:hypothetical protein APHAL10511_006905 [Amanita phalloides]